MIKYICMYSHGRTDKPFGTKVWLLKKASAIYIISVQFHTDIPKLWLHVYSNYYDFMTLFINIALRQG